MRNSILFSLVLFILGCAEKKTDKSTLEKIGSVTVNKSESTAKTVVESNLSASGLILSANELSEDTLVPLEIKNDSSANPFSKYGAEFNGNCYACDLAQICIGTDAVELINVCEPGNTFEFKVRAVDTTGSSIAFRSEKAMFIFTKIEPTPVFELKIVGNASVNNELRIVKYYTRASELPQFEIHDCGEFDG